MKSFLWWRTRAYLVLAAGLSAPWTPALRSEPDRRPGPGGSSDSGSEALPEAGRALQTGWEQTLLPREVRTWPGHSFAVCPEPHMTDWMNTQFPHLLLRSLWASCRPPLQSACVTHGPAQTHGTPPNSRRPDPQSYPHWGKKNTKHDSTLIYMSQKRSSPCLVQICV